MMRFFRGLAYHEELDSILGLGFSIPDQNSFTKCLLILVLIMTLAGAQVDEGDWCVTDDGDDGICRPLRHCSELASKTYVYNSGGADTPNLCSDSPYGGTIVCCRLNENTGIAPSLGISPSIENAPITRDQNKYKRPPQSPRSPPSLPGLGIFEDTVEVSAPDPLPLRISEQKCQEYTKNIDDTRRRFGELDSLSSRERCPFPVPANELIVGGKLAAMGQYPHMAALGYLKKSGLVEWLCGGSLISESYVLTAAHCASSRFGRMIVVRFGKLSLEPEPFSKIRVSVESSSGSVGDYAVGEIIRHKDHNFSALYNDIALVRLSQPVKEFNNLIRPACLNPDLDVEGKAIASGWGYTEFGGGPTDDVEKLLRHVTLNIHDNVFCNSLYKAETLRSSFSKGVVDSMVCAGELAGGKDSCQGDSGGPLQIRHPNDPCLHSVIGVTSFGKFCGSANSLGIYTRVSYYLPWIESIVWPQ